VIVTLIQRSFALLLISCVGLHQKQEAGLLPLENVFEVTPTPFSAPRVMFEAFPHPNGFFAYWRKVSFPSSVVVIVR